MLPPSEPESAVSSMSPTSDSELRLAPTDQPGHFSKGYASDDKLDDESRGLPPPYTDSEDSCSSELYDDAKPDVPDTPVSPSAAPSSQLRPQAELIDAENTAWLPHNPPDIPTSPSKGTHAEPRPRAELIDGENTSWLPSQHPISANSSLRRPQHRQRRSTVSHPIVAEILEGENRAYVPERIHVDTSTEADSPRRESIYTRAKAHIHLPHTRHLSPPSPSEGSSPTSPGGSRRHSKLPRLHLQVPHFFGNGGQDSKSPKSARSPVSGMASAPQPGLPTEAKGRVANAEDDAELLEGENSAWGQPTSPPLSAITPAINAIASLAIPSRRARRATISHPPPTVSGA